MKPYVYTHKFGEKHYQIHTIARDGNEANVRATEMLNDYNGKHGANLQLSQFEVIECDSMFATSYGRREPKDWIILDIFQGDKSIHNSKIVRAIQWTAQDNLKINADTEQVMNAWKSMRGSKK